MKLVIDIGHPAHVHFFKPFIREMCRKGHNILITATDKEVSFRLLENYGFSYIKMGSYGSSVMSKAFNIPAMDIKMAAHVSRFMIKPCITFDDTECSPLEHLLYVPFTDTVLTPSCFRKDLGRKQVRYNGYHELAYLHPNYFKPDPSVLDEVGLKKNEKYAVLRFVAWQASHDIGQHGYSLADKRKLVEEIEKHARVLITSENALPPELDKYRITLPPEKIHDLLYYTTLLYAGEGATMATEAAVLGTPSIYVSTLAKQLGNFIEIEQKYGLIYSFQDSEQAIKKAVELIQQPDVKEKWAKKRQRLLADKIDVTQFMVDFIENYPDSFIKYKERHRRV